MLSDLNPGAVIDPDAFAAVPPEFDILVCVVGNVWRADPARAFHVPRRLAGTKPVVCVLGNACLLGERLAPLLARAWAAPFAPSIFEEQKRFMDEMWSDAD
ncbi:hypothetical protein NS226_14280 [Aureimonas ureilytica]|uniref:Uncharacterized protein n=1 Tax=Aureimonas ureilytica TaxID=401562 RepID=A0A175R653_9HYPH|nr:hypothetical protein [Aureimonas ureilytica]KTQ94177.1 hypothetical protein NS226_14280 [Aureimonas ureilytica]